MLGDATPGRVGAPRRHGFASLKPLRDVLFNPILQRPRGAAHIGASARTFKMINDAASLVCRSGVFK